MTDKKMGYFGQQRFNLLPYFLTATEVPKRYSKPLKNAAVRGSDWLFFLRHSSRTTPNFAWVKPPAVMAVAEIDLKAIIRQKNSLDTIGHYSRPDIFRLKIDRSIRPVEEEMTLELQKISEGPDQEIPEKVEY